MYVVTGTPGTGNSTLITAFKQRGYAVYDEPVRKKLAHQQSIDGPALPSKNASLFIETLLAECNADISRAANSSTVSFFDRGLPDLIAYAIRFNVDTARVEAAAQQSRYEKSVFILPPWKDIFRHDDFRRESFEQYKAFHNVIAQSYIRMGYDLIEVPHVSIDLRVGFIENVLQS